MALAVVAPHAVQLVPARHLLPRIWALRENFSTYDVAYLALAEALTDDGVALLTTDARLARAVRAHTAIEVVSA